MMVMPAAIEAAAMMPTTGIESWTRRRRHVVVVMMMRRVVMMMMVETRVLLVLKR
jgi:hypothetical protein